MSGAALAAESAATLAGWLAGGGVLLGLGLLASRALQRASAATRAFVLALAIASAVALPAATLVVPGVALPRLRSVPAPSDTWLPPTATSDAQVLVAAATPPSPGEALGVSDDPPPGVSLAFLALVAWALGAGAVLSRFAWSCWRGAVLARDGRPAEHAGWARDLAAAAADAGVAVPPRLAVSEAAEGPVVTGLRRATLVLPPHALTWPAARRRCVLRHELSHVARGDVAWRALAATCSALHWLNPLAWLAASRLRLEQERVADDAAVAGGTGATDYAGLLVELARERRGRPAGAAAMTPRSSLGRRVASLLDPRVSRARPSVRIRVAASLLALAALGAVAALTSVREAVAEASSPAAPRAAAPAAPLLAHAPPVAPSPAPVAAPEPADPPGAPGPAPDAARPVAGRPAPLARRPAAPAAPLVARRPSPAGLSAFTERAREELDRLTREWDARRAGVLVLDPHTGRVLALEAVAPEGEDARDFLLLPWPDPGSTVKTVTVAAALEEGLVEPGEDLGCESGEWTTNGVTVRDWDAFGECTPGDVLALSSNVGAAKLAARLGPEGVDRWLRRFGLDAGVADSRPTSPHVFRAMGHGVPASPLDVAVAHGVVAAAGVRVDPRFAGGTVAARQRIVSAATARRVLDWLEQAVSRGTGRQAAVSGLAVAGKTGTARLGGSDGGVRLSFVGVVPSDRPRLVLLVAVETERGGATGGRVAAPVFARLAIPALGLVPPAAVR